MKIRKARKRVVFLLLFSAILSYFTVGPVVQSAFSEDPQHAEGEHTNQDAAHAKEGHESHAHQEGDHHYDPATVIMEHILDAHEWHILDLPNGTPVSVPLPWILYSSENGLDFFFLHAHSHEEMHRELDKKGYYIDQQTNKVKTASGGYVFDFSITKAVLHMILIGILMIWVFLSVAKGYKKRPNEAPRGIQSLFEPIIVFVREDIARPNLQERHERFMPYLLTVFFFIWFSNLLGLTPLNSNIMGNISVTAALAVVTFFITQASANKDHWQHVFWFPGVPVPVKFIMLPVEFIGLFTKPFALMVRLFANITAGHFMVISLVTMIFIMSNWGESAAGGFGFAPVSIAFTVFIMFLELLVAVLQAYVFTILSAVFIGQATEAHHDH